MESDKNNVLMKEFWNKTPLADAFPCPARSAATLPFSPHAPLPPNPKTLPPLPHEWVHIVWGKCYLCQNSFEIKIVIYWNVRYGLLCLLIFCVLIYVFNWNPFTKCKKTFLQSFALTIVNNNQSYWDPVELKLKKEPWTLTASHILTSQSLSTSRHHPSSSLPRYAWINNLNDHLNKETLNITHGDLSIYRI